jgi:hypothetical protein
MNPKNLREYLKSAATEIRNTRNELKTYQKENAGYDGGFYKKINEICRDYRHRHIAASLLRGTSYESIENPRQGNEPDWTLIQEIKDAYTTHVCARTA